MATTYHPAATYSMLPQDKNGVVDPNLVVYGTSNIHVCYLSILQWARREDQNFLRHCWNLRNIRFRVLRCHPGQDLCMARGSSWREMPKYVGYKPSLAIQEERPADVSPTRDAHALVQVLDERILKFQSNRLDTKHRHHWQSEAVSDAGNGSTAAYPSLAASAPDTTSIQASDTYAEYSYLSHFRDRAAIFPSTSSSTSLNGWVPAHTSNYHDNYRATSGSNSSRTGLPLQSNASATSSLLSSPASGYGQRSSLSAYAILRPSFCFL